jgi:hypothetical protein
VVAQIQQLREQEQQGVQVVVVVQITQTFFHLLLQVVQEHQRKVMRAVAVVELQVAELTLAAVAVVALALLVKLEALHRQMEMAERVFLLP